MDLFVYFAQVLMQELDLGFRHLGFRVEAFEGLIHLCSVQVRV